MTAGRFRDVMTRVTGPVTVVTAFENGTPYGTTVSSLASLSLDPPMVSVALDLGSALLPIVERTRTFGINILGQHQKDTAVRFTGPRERRFIDGGHRLDHGVPRLESTSGWIVCTVAASIPAGDHALLLGSVVDCAVGERAPMSYSQRTFGWHTPHRDEPSP